MRGVLEKLFGFKILDLELGVALDLEDSENLVLDSDNGLAGARPSLIEAFHFGEHQFLLVFF